MPTGMPVDLTLLRTSRLRTLIEIGTKDQLGQSLTWEFNGRTFAAPQLDVVAQVCEQCRVRGLNLEAALLSTHVSGGMVSQEELFQDRRVLTGACQLC
eukprot:2661547-Pyramimonas_sp.AAC.1